MSKTAVRHSETDTESVGETCDECGGDVAVDGVESVCQDCGLVVAENAIDPGPEWRSFDDGSSSAARAGTAVDPTRHDNGFSTRIGLERKRLKSGTHRRLLRAKRFSKHDTTRKPRDQGKCLSDIKAIAERLELPQSVNDNACVLFKEFHDATSHHGYSLDSAIAACVYASARIEQVGVGVDAVAEQVSITERKVFNTLDRLREEIDLAIPIASPRMYVTRYVEELDGDARTATLAQQVADEADEAGLTANGAAPSAVAAGCVYEAFVAAAWEPKRSQPEVGEVAGVSAYTVRRHWQRLQEAGISAGVGEELRLDDDPTPDDEPHAEEAEEIMPTPGEPVVIGGTRGDRYHTADCEKVTTAPARRLSRVTDDAIDWHDLDECGNCQRVRGDTDE